MVWQPQRKIVDTRFIARNILAYIAANQTDALFWANDNAAGLKNFKQFSESAANRAAPVFPSLAVVSDSNATTFDSDLLASRYAITFEAMIGSDSPILSPLIARKMKTALESLLLNIPTANLLDDVAVTTRFKVVSIETNILPIKANDMQNFFVQEFETKVIYEFYTGS